MDLEIVARRVSRSCDIWCFQYYAYLSLFDFVRISNNALLNHPSFLAFLNFFACSSVSGFPTLKLVDDSKHGMYIFSRSRRDSFCSAFTTGAVLDFFRNRVCIRKVKISLNPTDSASPRISILPPAATSSTDLISLTWVAGKT